MNCVILCVILSSMAAPAFGVFYLQKQGILLETIKLHFWHREIENITQPFICTLEAYTQSVRKLQAFTEVSQEERDALKVCVPDIDDFDCFEDPPCVSGVTEVMKGLSKGSLKYVVFNHRTPVFTALLNGTDGGQPFLVHTSSMEDVLKQFDILTCQPIALALRVHPDYIQSYVIRNSDPEFNASIFNPILGRKMRT